MARCGRVSIHAPAGGATENQRRSTEPRTCFNPRARGGRDACTLAQISRTVTFQSTRPRGARRDGGVFCTAHAAVSIHAPAGGATATMLLVRGTIDGFQSTRPRGARLSHHNSLIRRTVPAPLREPNACCQQRQTSKVSPGTNTLSINRLDMREPIRQSMSTWGSPQTGRPAECGMGQMVPRRSADHGSRRTALHRYARPYVASSGPGNRSEGCQPQGQSTPATDP